MTTPTSDKPVARRPETGWSRARRMKEKPALRTCVSAVRDPEGPARPDLALEGNIVRGED
ncbi:MULTISPECIES: hypothetical protein [unclassified Streptomyces]|uniref:hypothetical protein n=1 Tax=Streptomyces sp. NPDC052610 TaxID=3154952 RepID=UPI0009395B6E|nr:hypothetical protein [Streptomyces sp. TSRI0107]